MTTTTAEAIARAAERLAAAGVDDARLEAELLLAHARQCDRAAVIAALAETPDPGALATFEALLARRVRREPLAYITGHREFYGLDITCSPAALIPRPETELLVEIALEAARQHSGGEVRIVDVGTGSGAIACAIAVHAPHAHLAATDVSAEALALAATNTRNLGVSGRIESHETDLLAGLGVFDLIVANLPYVSEAEWCDLEPEVCDFEPKRALVPGPLGTEANVTLLASAAEHCAPGAVMALEIGATQAAVLGGEARERFPGAAVSVIKDLAGLDRVLVIRLCA